jgi:hypothetical protein
LSNPFKNQVYAYKPTLKQEIPLEDDEAVALSRWLRIKKIPHCHIPLEGRMKPQYMKKLSAMGVSKGFPDYIVFTPSKQLFIELKRRKKIKKNGELGASPSKVGDEQQEWIDNINCYGYAEARICYGWNEAQEFVEEYITMKKKV